MIKDCFNKRELGIAKRVSVLEGGFRGSELALEAGGQQPLNHCCAVL